MTAIAAHGEHTGRHNYYYPDDYFRFDRPNGVIRLQDDQRAARATEAFINGLHMGVEEEVGDASSGLLMYRCGYEWGQQDMKRFANRMRQEFGGGKKEIWQMNP